MNELLRQQIKTYLSDVAMSSEFQKFLENVSMTYDALQVSKAATAAETGLIGRMKFVLENLDSDFRSIMQQHGASSDQAQAVMDRIIQLVQMHNLAQRSADENSEILRNVIDNIPVYIFWKNTQSVYLGCNRQFAEALKLPDTEAVIGKTDYEFHVNREKADYFRRLDRLIFESGKPRLFFEEKYIVDGKEHILMTSKVPLFDNNGVVNGLVGIYSDITDMKQREHDLLVLNRNLKKTAIALAQEKERAELLYRVVPSAIFTVDTERKITSWNNKAAELTGFLKEEIIGKPCSFFSIDPCCSKGCGLRSTNVDSPVFGSECIIKRKDGRQLTVLKNTDVLKDEQGNVIGGIESLEDITERKQNEEELQRYRERLEQLVEERTEQLEDINQTLLQEIEVRKQTERELVDARDQAQAGLRAKSQFIANISHEIRTPLNSIVGFSEMIKEATSAEIARKHATVMLRESDMLLQIINQVLDYSKLEAGKIEIEKVSFALRPLIQSIKESLSARAVEKGLNFSALVDQAVPDWIITDQLRLRQILLNLIDNAIKFTEHGSVSLNVGTVADDANGMILRFIVADTGIGIPEEKKARIFESFTQVDGSTTRRYGGTGLGTTIAKQLVELMGGRISFESQATAGTVFWFEIPVERTDELQVEKASTVTREMIAQAWRTRSGKNARILLVEDYEPNQHVFIHHLSGLPITCETSTDGRQAVAICREREYDLIIMDIQMPEMDGYQATREIRKGEGPNKGKTIIALTANADDATRHSCVASGMNDVLAKPLRRDVLYAILYKWLCSGAVEVAIAPVVSADSSALPIDFKAGLSDFDNDEELFKSVLQNFLAQADGQWERIDAALAVPDREVLRKESHKLRGGAANLIANPLAAAAAHVEQNSATLSDKDLRAAVQEMRKQYEQVKNVIRHRFYKGEML